MSRKKGADCCPGCPVCERHTFWKVSRHFKGYELDGNEWMVVACRCGIAFYAEKPPGSTTPENVNIISGGANMGQLNRLLRISKEKAAWVTFALGMVIAEASDAHERGAGGATLPVGMLPPELASSPEEMERLRDAVATAIATVVATWKPKTPSHASEN